MLKASDVSINLRTVKMVMQSFSATAKQEKRFTVCVCVSINSQYKQKNIYSHKFLNEIVSVM